MDIFTFIIYFFKNEFVLDVFVDFDHLLVWNCQMVSIARFGVDMGAWTVPSVDGPHFAVELEGVLVSEFAYGDAGDVSHTVVILCVGNIP